MAKRGDKSCHQLSDDALVAMLKAGGPQREKAIDCIAQRCGPKLLKHAKWRYWRLGAETINDAFTEALLDLIRAIDRDKYHGNAKLCTFLNIIFQRRCIDFTRQKTTNVSTTPLDEVPPPMETGSAEDSDEEECLRMAMLELPPKKRELLADWSEGYSYEELAAKNSLTVNSVGPTLNLAKRLLEEAIRKLCERRLPVCMGLCKRINQ
jgi:RNA polymerase sigma factor (sigma-70 family)